MSKRVATNADPYKFLNSKRAKVKLLNAKHNITQRLTTRDDIKLVTAYAAVKIIYTNSQRSGIIQNLTIEEYEMRTFCDDQYAIPCTHHMTGPQGQAQLVVTKKGFSTF